MTSLSSGINENNLDNFLLLPSSLEEFEATELAPNEKFLVTSQVSSTNQFLTASQTDYGLHYWDLEAKTKTSLRSNIKHLTTAITTSSDSKLIATGGLEDAVRVFDAKTKKTIFRSKRFKNSRAHSLAFSPDNKYLAFSYMYYESFSLIVWDLQTKQPVFDTDAVYIDAFNIKFSEDGKNIVTDKGNSIDIFDKNTDEINHSTHPECTITRDKHFASNQDLAIDADYDSELIKVIVLKTGEVLNSFNKRKYQAIQLGWFIKNNSQLLIALKKGEIKLYDLKADKEIKTIFNLKANHFVRVDSLGNHSFSSARLPNLILKKTKAVAKTKVVQKEIINKCPLPLK